MMKRQIATAMVCAALVACLDQSSATSQASVSYLGTYDLVSANGKSPPFLGVQGPTERIDLVAENLVLGADGTWRDNQVEEYVYATSTARDSFMYATGTFALIADTLWFTATYPGYGNPFPPHLVLEGTIRNDTLMTGPIGSPPPTVVWRQRR